MKLEEKLKKQKEFLESFKSEDDFKKYLMLWRWPDGVLCPKCNGKHCYELKNGNFECSGCGKQFSLTSGTIFEKTRTSFRTWFEVILFTRSNFKISTIKRRTGKDYKSAWLLVNKIRKNENNSDLKRLFDKDLREKWQRINSAEVNNMT